MTLNFEGGNLNTDPNVLKAESLAEEQAFTTSEQGQTFLKLRLAEYLEPAKRNKILENNNEITVEVVREAAKKVGQLNEFNDKLKNILSGLAVEEKVEA